MSAKDIIHDTIVQALLKDGWVITDDPLTIEFEDARVFIDVGAEKVIAAEREHEKIAVEIKSFIGYSTIQDMKVALGQFMIYLGFLEELEPERILWIGISQDTYMTAFQRKSIKFIVKRFQVPLLVVDTENAEVKEWIQN